MVLQYICFMCLLIDLIASKPHDHSAKLAHAVPFKVTVDISSPDILEQIASYMPESQLHSILVIMNSWTQLYWRRLRDWDQYEWTEEARDAENKIHCAAGKASPNLNLFGCQWALYEIHLSQLLNLHCFIPSVIEVC